MTVTKTEIRQGTYYDSVILMQLQAALVNLSGVQNVGVMMGTEANKDLLAQSDLLTPEAKNALLDDLIIAIEAEDEAAAESALGQIDTLLAQRRSTAIEAQEYMPQSLEAATKMRPDAGWVLISVPGRYAAGVARESLRLGKHVFLYSDNVSLEDEISLKQTAAQQQRLVMGPDCGTAIVNGVGLGFANRVRRGPIGIIGASGTGLQQVTARIHQLGGGITHALGTGGRDLSEAVGAVTAQQGLDLLIHDPETKIIVLISKPPAQAVANHLVRLAQAAGKPVVINFIGYHPPADLPRSEMIHFVASLDQTAELAVKLAGSVQPSAEAQVRPEWSEASKDLPFAQSQRYLRGLFSGGTLAYEALLILQEYLPAVYSNAPLDKKYRLANSLISQEHTIVDLGEDEFTVGRLHPMMDNALRIQRLRQEANDPETALILLDVVLGYGAHPNPAGELAPVIAQAIGQSQEAGRHLEVVAVVVGTDEDPQNMAEQLQQLQQAGAKVETNNEVVVRYVGQRLQSLNLSGQTPSVEPDASQPTASDREAVALIGEQRPSVEPDALQQPLVAINVGLESFTESLTAQEAEVIHVNWRPSAGGNQKLMSILERMKKR